MNKDLDLIKRQQPEIIDGFPTGNIYIGVTKEELAELTEELKALEIIKERKIVGLTLEWDGKWWTVCVHDYKFPIAYGSKKEEYDLLKEVLKDE